MKNCLREYRAQMGHAAQTARVELQILSFFATKYSILFVLPLFVSNNAFVIGYLLYGMYQLMDHQNHMYLVYVSSGLIFYLSVFQYSTKKNIKLRMMLMKFIFRN